jgi:hypothetical protein
VDLKSIALAPVRVPLRIARALDDLADIAERARRDPDPVEEVRVRIDALLLQLDALNVVAREIRDGGRELTETAKAVTVVGSALHDTAIALDTTGRTIVSGGQDLVAVASLLHVDTRELIDGGEDLTAVSDKLETHMRIFRAALPRLLKGLDTVEELETAVETVAETVEPLQGAAERVGRVTDRFTRSRD